MLVCSLAGIGVFAVHLWLATVSAPGGSRVAPRGSQAAAADQPTITELDAALQADRFDFVIKHCKRRLKGYPESDETWLLLGWAYVKTDNLDEAQKAVDKSLSINKSKDNAYVALGVIHRKAGRLEQARSSYKKALKICPDNPAALSSLLVIEMLTGNYGEAVVLGEKAWQGCKNLASIPANLCVAYHYQGNIAKRDYFYKKAKELGYPKMNGLDDFIAGKLTIGPGVKKSEKKED